MFGFFKRKAADKSESPSLDAVRFDSTGYKSQGDPQPGSLRLWHSPDGDGVGLYFFDLPPNLVANAPSIDELADLYRDQMGDTGVKLVEINVGESDGCQLLRTIISAPQSPSGRTYVGSLTIPFRDFSFVLKCQCAEAGTTGLKEAVLLERGLAANKVTMEEVDGQAQIVSLNPDDPKYDAEFPDHPIARARRTLAHLAGSIRITDSIKRLPGFPLPR